MATKEQMTRLNEMGEIAGEIIHEMGGHITVVKAVAGAMRQYVDDPELLREFLEDLDDGIQRLEGELNTVKSMASGHPSPLTKVNLSRALSAIPLYVNVNVNAFSAERIAIDIDNSVNVKSSRAILFQIVHNLTKNALEASPDAVVNITSYESGDYIMLVVRDNGNGMTAAQVDSMFGDYSSNNSDTAVRGLGLQNVKRGVRQIYAEINCASALGEGTTFTIRLDKY